MRRFTQLKELVKPAKTRFATAFSTLQRVCQQRNNLKKMFTSEEWIKSKWTKEPQGKKTAQILLMPSFWNHCHLALQFSCPIVRVLRKVDGEGKPPMGYIYEAMDRAKEAIANSFSGNEEKYKDVFQIIEQRWNVQLHSPLHATGFYLNPEFFYKDPRAAKDKEIVSGLYQCISRLIPALEVQDKVTTDLKQYENAKGLFRIPMAIRQRTTRVPDDLSDWWSSYGHDAPELQQFAIKVLNLTCSSSGCEKNWSVFEHLHSKKRNRLAQKRLNDLVFIKYNRALKCRYISRGKFDPISLKDIDESNKWLIGRMENEPVFDDDDDDSLGWNDVAGAAGVEESSQRTRPTTTRTTPIGSSSRRLVDEEEWEDVDSDEEEEEDVEGYKSNDDEEDDGDDASY
ncbi:uncharacterized protein LOC114310603 [Camellia sinensis]|uniref:uncharacterized protein LOC114310603 n=1 Tax=Camellia sinensis TaxID=4442 RepID=UPI001036B9EF|nr:uncharacterized protein LOC114310603 [Camellia sinensis]